MGSLGFPDIDKIADLFGGGPLSAFIALLCVAVVVLFWQLMKSQRAHLATTAQLIPVAEKLNATLTQNNAIVAEAVRVLDRAVTLHEGAEAASLVRERLAVVTNQGGKP